MTSNTDTSNNVGFTIEEKTDTETTTPKQTTVVFCVPGDNFSSNFLQSWSELLSYCFSNNIRPILSSHKSNNVYYVRNMCLGGNFVRGIEQKPFNGELDYDYLMWIDSDQVFSAAHFARLMAHDKDVVSGIYIMSNNRQYTVCQKMDIEYLMKNGEFEFLDRTSLESWIRENVVGTPEEKEEDGKKILDLSGCAVPLMEAEYCGLGWTLMKKGVMEQLEYPWFNQLPIEVMSKSEEGGSEKVVIRDYCSEDVALFSKLKSKDIKCYVDVLTMIGHEKKIVL